MISQQHKKKLQSIKTSPGYGSHTSEFLDVPDANESIGTARGKVLAPGVHLDTDTVGRVGIQNNLGLHLRVAGGTIKYVICSEVAEKKESRALHTIKKIKGRNSLDLFWFLFITPIKAQKQ